MVSFLDAIEKLCLVDHNSGEKKSVTNELISAFTDAEIKSLASIIEKVNSKKGRILMKTKVFF
jgi:hypothetical protein